MVFVYIFRPHRPQEQPKISKIDPKSDLGPPAEAQEQPKTANIPKSGPGPPTEPQERPRMANIGPKSGPGPPAEDPRPFQDHPQRPVKFPSDHQSKM